MNIAQNPNSELSHFAVNTPQVFDSVEVRSARNPHNKILSIIYVRVKQKEEKPVLSKVRRGRKRKKETEAEEE